MYKNTLTILFLGLSNVIFAQQQPDSTKVQNTAPEEAPTTSAIRDTVTTGEVISNVKGNKSGFFPAVDLRSIDGLFLGLGYKFVSTDAAKRPSSVQKISAMKNLKSEAFQAKYSGVWTSVFGNTDIVLDAFADVKGNIINYFGRGNETPFDQSDGFQEYYRAKFSLYQIDPALRFNFSKTVSLTVGPSLQYSVADFSDNNDRFIGQAGQTADFGEKLNGGGILGFNWDTRDNKLLPARGLNLLITVQSYTALNTSATSFTRLSPQLSLYKKLDASGKFVIAERLGAGFTSGTPAFYQNNFLGSEGNLLGYRKFRFAGDQVVYNNLETRLTLLTISGKKLKAKAGINGFYDAGRVWIENDDSDKIHHGYGGGIFLSPMNRALLRLDAGFSEERLQITASVRQRF